MDNRIRYSPSVFACISQKIVVMISDSLLAWSAHLHRPVPSVNH